MSDLTRTVGYLQNISKGNESAAAQIAHLIIGVFGGLPPYAVSLRVTIAFYVSCILEVPSGVVADIIGHARSMVYACIFYSMACVFIVVAVVASSDDFSLIMVVLSSVLSALGGALSSGSFQALLQDLIDREALSIPAVERTSFKIRTLSLSQGHGAYFASFFPVAVMAILFFWARYWEGEEYILFLPAVAFVGFAMYFQSLVPDQGYVLQKNRIRVACASYIAELKHLKSWLISGALNKRIYFYGFSLLMVFSTLLMIHVHTYLMISQLREVDIRAVDVKGGAIIFLMLASFDLAHLVKGWLVPFLTRKFADIALLFISYFSVASLSFLAWLGCYYEYQLLSLIVFVLFFRAFLTLGQNIIQSTVLVMLPENNRATALSAIQVIVILVYASYSLYLTFVGIESPPEILMEVLVLSMCCLLVALIVYVCCGQFNFKDLAGDSV